jgi:hypothetical protein
MQVDLVLFLCFTQKLQIIKMTCTSELVFYYMEYILISVQNVLEFKRGPLNIYMIRIRTSKFAKRERENYIPYYLALQQIRCETHSDEGCRTNRLKWVEVYVCSL